MGALRAARLAQSRATGGRRGAVKVFLVHVGRTRRDQGLLIVSVNVTKPELA